MGSKKTHFFLHLEIYDVGSKNNGGGRGKERVSGKV
jgi:hypothetical protein